MSEELKSMDEIREEYNKQKAQQSNALTTPNTIEKEAEIVDSETGKLNPALATFKTLRETSHEEVVTALQNKKTLEVATTDKEISKKMDDNAKKLIDNQLEETENNAITRNQESFSKRHRTATRMYGYPEDGDPRPKWQTTMMRIGADCWFVVYFIIATFTVCPLSVFFDVFRAIFKKGWLAMVVSIIVYLAIAVGIPLLASYIPTLRQG